MIELERASPADLPRFAAMEAVDGTRQFVNAYSVDRHERTMAEPNVTYLRIMRAGELVGFFLLVGDPDDRSVEFRRIVVGRQGEGIGQRAIPLMERFCRVELGAERIWLDVYADNTRGQHIYEKLGFTRCAERPHDGRTLFVYEKRLPARQPIDSPDAGT